MVKKKKVPRRICTTCFTFWSRGTGRCRLSAWAALRRKLTPFVFCLHLLDLCLRHPVLNNVLTVVSQNLTQLLVTLGLGFVLIYIYTVFGFLFFNNQYSITGQEGCENLLTCYMLHLDYGLRDAPTFDMPGASVYTKIYQQGTLWSYAPWLFSFSYNLAIILILVAIISGIIIDSFGAMRESMDAKKR